MDLKKSNNTNTLPPYSPSCSINIFPSPDNIYFCGYSVFKKTLQEKGTYLADATVITLINDQTNMLQKNTLLNMYYNQIIAVNTNSQQDQELAKKHGFYTNEAGCPYLYIKNRKLETAWENIDSILNISSILPSWGDTIFYSSISAAMMNILSHWTNIAIIKVMLDIFSYGGISLLLRFSCQFISDATSSKPLHYSIRRKKTFCETEIHNNFKMHSFSKILKDKDHYSVTTFIDIDKFYLVFDNLYKILEITREETPYFFKATLLGIANTWMSMIHNNASSSTDIYSINKQIIENTLLTLELNNIYSYDKTDIILDGNQDLTLASTMAIQNIMLEQQNKEGKNILSSTDLLLSNLEQGFYTSVCDIFFVLYIDKSSSCESYSLFIPILNLVYRTPIKQYVTDVIKNLSSNKEIKFIKFGGKL